MCVNRLKSFKWLFQYLSVSTSIGNTAIRLLHMKWPLVPLNTMISSKFLFLFFCCYYVNFCSCFLISEYGQWSLCFYIVYREFTLQFQNWGIYKYVVICNYFHSLNTAFLYTFLVQIFWYWPNDFCSPFHLTLEYTL